MIKSTKTIIALFLSIVSSSFAQTPKLTLSSGHTSGIRSVLFSPDGRFILTGGNDNTIKLWDIRTGNEIRTFVGHTSPVLSSCFISENVFASGSYDKTIRIWNFLTGEQVKTIKTDFLISSVCISHNGKYLATSHFIHPIALWDPSTGAMIKAFEKFDDMGKSINTRSLCFSIDDKFILSGSDDNTVRLWSVETGKIVKSFIGHSDKITSVNFSGDGRIAISASEDKTIKMWDVESGKEIRTLNGHIGKIYCLDVSKNDRYIVSGGEDKAIKIWELSSGKELNALTGITGEVYSVCFSPDDRYILSSSYEQARLWDVFSGKEIKTIKGLSSGLDFFAIKPDGKTFLCEKSKITTWWELGTGKTSKPIELVSTSNSFSFDGQRMASAETDNTVKLVDFAGGNEPQTVFKNDSKILCIDISKDGNTIIIGDEGNSIKLLNVNQKEKPKVLRGHKNRPTAVKFLPDGQRAVSIGWDHTLFLWDIKKGKKIKAIEEMVSSVYCMDISPDGKWAVTGGLSDNILVWDLVDGKLSRRIGKSKGDPFSIYFAPDGKTIATCGYEDHEITFWDFESGKIIKTFKGHTDSPIYLNFLPDGKRIVTYSFDRTVRLWNIENEMELATIHFLEGGNWIASTREGLFDGTEQGMKKLYYVKDLETIPIESFFEQYYTPKLLNRLLNNELITTKSIKIEEINTAPIVKITSPENNTTISKEQVVICVKAVDQGGGVDEIRLYHNGKLLDGTQRGFKQVGTEKQFTVYLTDGENRIKATAFNNQRTEAIPDEIVVNYKAPQVIKPNMHILAVGINTYLNPKYSLNFAKNDAEAFAQSLKAGAESIFGSVNLTSLSDANATRTGIMAALDKIKSTAKPEDVFVFYYAGHGVMSTGNETEKPLFFLVPYDVTKMYEADDILKKLGISANEIGEFSKNIKAQKQLFVIDACQSGGAIQTLASRGAAEEKAIAQLARSTGTYFIAASGTEQFATEVAELGHGIFTYSVIEALKGSCKSQDGKVTVNLLKSCVEDLVPELSKKHKGQPQFPTGYGFGQDFPIVICK